MSMRKDLMRKFSREYLAKYPSVTKIYEAIAGSRRMGSEVTVEHYVSAVAKFVKYLGFSDPEIALKAMQNGEVDATAKVDKFIDYALDELGKSHSTVRNYVHGVKKWLELNGVKVDWAKIEMPTATETVETDRAPTKEELKILLNHASSCRDRFIINVLTSSGLRIGTLLSLKIGDVDSSPPDVAIIRVEKARGRKFGSKRSRGSGRLYVTFMTPEAKISMQQYLNEREVSGEKLTADSPLITDYTNKGDFITIDAYSKVWSRLLKKAGLNQKAHLYHTLHIHTLRKYFRSNCIGVDASYRERWMGHKGLYLDESYFRAEESLHLSEYRKAIPHLTLYALPTEEKKLRSQMLVDFARLQGYSGDELKKLEDVLARSKDVEEAITEFKKLKDEASPANASKPKHIIAKGEKDLLRHLDDGYKMLETLDADKFLLERL
jgi:integrase